MRVVLHIGAHKTGTSSIQATMNYSGPALAESGVLYPRCCWLDTAHHRLAYAMKGKVDPRQRDQPELAAEIADLTRSIEETNSHTALISSEELFTAGATSIASLAEGLRAHRVEIVAYVRRPDQMLESAFNQKLKQIYRDFKRDTNVNYYIDDYIENPASIAPDIDYLGHISKWVDVFGVNQVKLVEYEQGDAVDIMCGILGIDRAKLIDSRKRENPRASHKVVAILRLAREMGASLDVQEKIRELAWAMFPYAEDGGLLDVRDRVELLRRYRADNEKLFRLLLDKSNPYDPELIELSNTGSSDDRLKMADVMRMVIQLVAAKSTH